MTNKERIEAYFDNELSQTERESLLSDIDSDPSLKTEFDFQNEVVDGIQAYRKQELIARLNNVKVASTGNTALYKIFGAVGVAAVLTGGLYWFNSSDNTAGETPQEIILLEEAPSASKEIINEEGSSAEQVRPEEPMAEETIQPKSTDQAIIAEEENKKVESETPEVVIPELTEPDSEGIAALEDNHDAPKSLNSESVSVSSSADVEIKLSKKYNFHYQVVSGDLTLYGDFNDSKFEVIELKTNLGIRLYLFYNELYYELKSDSEEIRALTPVEEKTIVDELNKRRQ